MYNKYLLDRDRPSMVQGLFPNFIAFINGIMFNMQKNIQNPKDKKKKTDFYKVMTIKPI